MKLFLASMIAYSLDKIDELLSVPPEQLKVAFIPTAADPYGKDPEWLLADRRKLQEKGFQVFDIDIKGKNEERLRDELSGFDIIFVSGGNTFYLLEKAQESGFDKVVKELVLDKEVIYIGSSAGAILAGPSILPTKLLDDLDKAPNLKSYEGLGLVDFVVLPHYGREKYAHLYEKMLNDPENKKYKMISITDEQAIVVNGDSHRIV